MSPPSLSVVVASVNGFPYLGRCLESLTAHAPDAELIVADCTDARTRRRVIEGWPAVRVISFDEPATVPALRAAGLFAATAPRVAVLEDHCVVPEPWAEAMARDADPLHVVGGPIRNHTGARLRDWAGFLFEYSAFLEPVERGPARALPGMNVSYSQAAVEAMTDVLRAGKWESWLHARLRERGFELRAEPDGTIEHRMDFGIAAFTAQRFHYARAYADMRRPDLGSARFLYALATPLLVPLLCWRVLRNVRRSRRHGRELALAAPLLLWYAAVTAGGEAIGYVAGGGRSLLRVR